MPLIGFTMFKDKILDGTKTQTIRKVRKHPIKVGDKLYLYWHPRQKDCEKLGEAVCVETFRIRIEQEYFLGKQHLRVELFDPNQLGDVRTGWIRLWKDLDIEQMYDLITRDGFKDANEMLTFFIKHYPLPEVFQVIRWAMPSVVQPRSQ